MTLSTGPLRPIFSKAERPDWWRGAVIYQIYPRSFQDDNGDGIGDLKGIARRLGHVAELGADAVWLSPFFTSPMKDFGYDISDYRGVDPIFGTLADFDALIVEAHRLGLKLMIDQVLSHTSDQHPWFAESRRSRDDPKADWYVWANAKPDGTPPTNWLSIFGGSSWEWDTRRSQYYLHNFLVSQPDLNFHHPEVQDALLADVAFWLDRGVDGFRLDTVNFYFHDAQLRNNPSNPGQLGAETPALNPYSWQFHDFDKNRPEVVGFLERFRTVLDRYPGSAAVGEIGEGERALGLMGEYTAGESRLHMCYTFDLLGPAFAKDYLDARIRRFEAEAGTSWPCWAFSNHDVVRHVSRFTSPGLDPVAVAKLSANLILSMRGSVCLYQGEELGLMEADLAFEDLVDPYGITFWPEFKGRDGCRTPMPWGAGDARAGFSAAEKSWLPVPAEHLAASVEAQALDETSVLAHYRRMLAFRTHEAAMRMGTITFLESPDDVLAFRRDHGNEAILCVFHLGAGPAEMPVPDGLALTPVKSLGVAGRLEDRRIVLPGLSAFFAQID
ncbi:MAG: alpha-glucosidase [Rhizobiaceae bacterium]|nr:alpha-glucosidase [Rhizobiaceae bacterium]